LPHPPRRPSVAVQSAAPDPADSFGQHFMQAVWRRRACAEEARGQFHHIIPDGSRKAGVVVQTISPAVSSARHIRIMSANFANPQRAFFVADG